MVSGFTKAVSSSFGIDNVGLTDLKRAQDQSNALQGYIINTKKTYIDNQLSEYSAFPELISYKNRGFKSCAIMPLIADGKVVSMLEMLSKDENKFSDELVGSVAFGASFIGFVLMYKGELNRSVKLATYFDAAFNNQYPQLIVADDGSIVKFNKSAVKQFDMTVPEKRKIEDLIGTDFKKLIGLPTNSSVVVAMKGKNSGKVYQVVSSKINDRLVHMAANDITDAFVYSTINSMVMKNDVLCVVLTDQNFKITNITSNAESIFGFSKTLLSNGNFLDMISKAERNPFTEGFAESLKDDSDIAVGSVSFELGEAGKRYMHYTAKRFLNGYIFLLVRADTEKYMENLQKDMQDFIETSSDIVLGVDSLGYIRECNMPVESILGFKKEEMIGKELKLLYKEQDLLDRDINYVRNVGKVDYTLVNLIAKNSDLVPATHSVRMLHAGARENGVEYLITIKELATKRELESMDSELRDIASQLKRQKTESDLKSQFISSVSHELKTPLTSITGFSKLLYNGDFGPLNDEQKKYIGTTLDEAARLLLIIQQILDAAKLEADKIKLEPKEVDLKNMENNPSIKAQEESARGKGIDFKWDAAWDVPKITADPNRLIQIFVNLIGNAIKFTEKGSITVRIVKLNKRNVQCNIIDTGIGISEEDKKKLHYKRKFYEITKKDKEKELVQQQGAGTGLGLAITRDLVRLHGGKFGFESTVGKGSTFWFTLPINPRPKKKDAPKQD